MGSNFCSNCSISPDTLLNAKANHVNKFMINNRKKIESNLYNGPDPMAVKSSNKMFTINNINELSFSFTKKRNSQGTTALSPEEINRLSELNMKNKVNLIIKSYRKFKKMKKNNVRNYTNKSVNINITNNISLLFQILQL